MVIVITISTSGARNTHVMIKFLLIILTDMPKEIIHHGKLFDLLARVGAFIREIRLIKEEVSNISEKIPKNKSLVVVNSTKNPVERKSLTTGNIIVGFKEETNWLISKLTSGPKDLDVISITGMPGSDKTTLAYKLYNDESVCSHFDLRAWCTVDQEYDKKKRYLIVLDDVWDIDTWDELTRPFPKVVNVSRIIFKTRQKEVAFHGKCNTDPLNLRLLSSEESWELLEKRAFGKESCPDEILDVGKEIALNCKGLPLVIDLIAGVIVGREKTKSVWLEVRNNLNSFILSSEVEVMKMMSLEEVMEIYLDNLISSSLIIAFNEIGNHPTCQIHGLVHDFCLIKARQEKLLGKISSSDPSSSSDLMPRIVTIFYDKEHCGPNNFVLLNSKKKRHSGKHLCSLLITADEMEDRLSDACRDFLLTSYSLSTIARLPNLEVLFLVRKIFQGEEWNIGEEDTFENHKYLELEEVTLAKTLPCFPKLFLHAQFTPPSWCAAAIPNTASLLLPNASVFNCPTWLSASFTDEHTSPIPLSRILKSCYAYFITPPQAGRDENVQHTKLVH
ncbi:putative late blight resistance protein -like protein R1B-14-like [Capsicum annuum]|nr:putative late blight resistance protein -like protein R1B-14-like [Capsicum annuum]